MLVSLHGLTGLAVYLVVFGIVFAESGLLLGFFLPGDTVLFAAGLLAADRTAGVRLPVLVVGVVVLAVVGDAVGYAFGRRAGRPLLARRDGRVLNQANLARARAFYARYGAGAVVAARFVPWVRTFTPILAGVSEMSYRVFLAANVLGALVWGAGLLVLGYASASLPVLRHASYAVAGTVVLLSAVPGVLRWRASRRPGRGG
ncbi:MAG: DedA family protein [Mycobacteriales bacterium]